jgi:DNA repair ATPase RecN
MGCIGKTVVRGVVITALAGGVLVAVAGPQRVGALVQQTRGNIVSVIDDNIDDPILLRAQIKKLEAQYPGKIAEVWSDLSEVQTQIAHLDREMKIATKAAELAVGDLEVVDAQIAQARVTQSANPGAIVRISFDNEPLDLEKAYGKRQQIEQNRNQFASHAHDLQADLGYLRDQEAQLAELYERLTSEQDEFQAKLVQLDAVIDSIARNERMIDMMEDRQATIDEHSRFQANSLDQLNSRLSQIRAEQRSRIENITKKNTETNYIDEAKFIIDQEGRVQDFEHQDRLIIEPTVIEITPEDAEPSKPMASNN